MYDRIMLADVVLGEDVDMMPIYAQFFSRFPNVNAHSACIPGSQFTNGT
jgi:hypothetical protein